MEELIQAMTLFNGMQVVIVSTHRIFGQQKIYCRFEPKVTKEKIGFDFNAQYIFMNKKDIIFTQCTHDIIVISDQNAEFKISLLTK